MHLSQISPVNFSLYCQSTEGLPGPGWNFNAVVCFLTKDHKKAPDLLNRYMQTFFEFDLNNVHIPPRLMFIIRKGACDDYSFFALAVLRKAGYKEAVIIQVFDGTQNERLGHAVCVYKDPSTNLWCYIDDEGIHKVNLPSIQRLANDIFPKWTKIEIISKIIARPVAEGNDARIIDKTIRREQ